MPNKYRKAIFHNLYLTVSDKIIDGSPKNSITAVPVGKPIPVK